MPRVDHEQGQRLAHVEVEVFIGRIDHDTFAIVDRVQRSQQGWLGEKSAVTKESQVVHAVRTPLLHDGAGHVLAHDEHHADDDADGDAFHQVGEENRDQRDDEWRELVAAQPELVAQQ